MCWALDEARLRNCSVTAHDSAATNAGHADPLVDHAVGAELLVVGPGAVGNDLRTFASAARRAARRRSCPVVVVRGRRRPLRRITVGVDCSNAAATALDWAIDEADLHEASLRVIHAWQPPTRTDRFRRSADPPRSDAMRIVDVAVAYVQRHTTLPVRGCLVRGDPGTALTAHSAHTDLLVVGSRGRSGFRTMSFGSVALAVASGSDCPVVIVHPQLRPAR